MLNDHNYKLLIANGDQKKFSQMMELTSDELLWFAIGFLKNKEIAEEIVSDVYVNIWYKRAHLEKINNLKSYLFVSVRNGCLSHLRKVKNEKIISIDSVNEYSFLPVEGPEDSSIEKEIIEQIYAAIETLPCKCKLVFTLAKINGLKYREIAEVLGITEKTVNNHLVLGSGCKKNNRTFKRKQKIQSKKLPIETGRSISFLKKYFSGWVDFPTSASLHLKKHAVEVNEQLYELITKELTSDISEDEKKLLDFKISENLELRQKKELLHHFWFNYFPKPLPNRIIQKTEKKLGFNNRSKFYLSFGFIYKIVATVLLILSLGYIAYQHFNPETGVSLNEYVTLPGEVKEFVLSDGTKVWLNSKTVLIASEPFVDEGREVLLIGEGYFEVAHNAEKPFIIKTSSLKTMVLGTHLNISAHPGDIKTEVSLYEGKVELSDKNMPDSKIVIKPGQKVSFSNDEKHFQIKSNELEKPAEWREGILRFYDEDLNSISKKLERKFMTKIFIMDDEVGKLSFTASFDTEPLDKILNLLSEAHEFKTLKTTNGIIIKSIKNSI